eukprot:GHVU01164352.1.p1 GENE.GHVU01164352.1~~GHVU01164352.1.p1  ORF type:complete len:115 (-),score=12.29 GHVU01164352.1:598-942(-)
MALIIHDLTKAEEVEGDGTKRTQIIFGNQKFVTTEWNKLLRSQDPALNFYLTTDNEFQLLPSVFSNELPKQLVKKEKSKDFEYNVIFHVSSEGKTADRPRIGSFGVVGVYLVAT